MDAEDFKSISNRDEKHETWVESMGKWQQSVSHTTVAFSTVMTLKLRCLCNLGQILSALSDGQVGGGKRGRRRGPLCKIPRKQEEQMPGIGVLIRRACSV